MPGIRDPQLDRAGGTSWRTAIASRRSSELRIACSALSTRLRRTCCSCPPSASTLGSARREAGGELDAGHPERVLAQRDDPLADVHDILRGARRSLSAGEREEVANDPRRALRLFGDAPQVLSHLLRRAGSSDRPAAPLRRAARSRSRWSAGCSIHARHRPRAGRSPTASRPEPAAPASPSADRASRRAGRSWSRAPGSFAEAAGRSRSLRSRSWRPARPTVRPSAGPIGNVVTLKIWPSGRVISARDASCASARLTAHRARDPRRSRRSRPGRRSAG